MVSHDAIAARRFGYGAGPGAARGGPGPMLDDLAGPDRAARLWPAPEGAIAEAHRIIEALREISAQMRREGATDAREAQRRAAARRLRASADAHAALSLSRILDAPDPFRERLVWFWTDHLAVAARSTTERGLAAGYVEEAIRPHVTGRFADMLRAATLHPVMLEYLDQRNSIGPGSQVGRDMGRGLNENHARELLELHTLGVGGGYAQADVRQLAELMTGVTTRRDMRVRFAPARAEPGAETVLGRTYGGDPARLGHIEEALGALAVHPDTARHLARKLAVHFVSDAPPEGLVADLEAAWLAHGGDLMPIYEILLTHPQALSGPPAKIRPPFEWVATCLRALGVPGAQVAAMGGRDLKRDLLAPLAAMGQPYMRPPGPDGWPEEAGRWAEPHSLAERIAWAMEAPARLLPDLPDPRELLREAVPWGAPDELAFAARAAERRRDGVGLVLVSPSLMRR